MQRIASFPVGDMKNQQRFDLLYSAILLGHQTATRQAAIGMELVRREARIFDALDEASTPDDNLPKLASGDAGRKVKDGADLVLPDPEHALLLKRLEELPWLPAMARKAVDVVDWLKGAREHLHAIEGGESA